MCTVYSNLLSPFHFHFECIVTYQNHLIDERDRRQIPLQQTKENRFDLAQSP